MLTKLLILVASVSGFAASPALAGGGGLLGMTVAASVEGTMRALVDATSEATLRSTTCATTHADCERHRCPWGDACWTERLPLDVAARLHREAYAFRGATLQEVAGKLHVAPETLAAAIIQRVPEKPSRDDLERILVLAAPS